MPEAQCLVLSNEDAIDITWNRISHTLEQVHLILRGQLSFKFIGLIEMIFDRPFVAARNENHIPDACHCGFFNGILDEGLINDRHHFLRTCLGRRQKSSSQAGNGEYSLSYLHLHFLLWHFNQSQLVRASPTPKASETPLRPRRAPLIPRRDRVSIPLHHLRPRIGSSSRQNPIPCHRLAQCALWLARASSASGYP